ncbi:MAG: hypothetical protein HDS92_00995 [Bacteroidales bacterium]|nr:hypothetical protein [Bacteroidales bacterium]
MKSWQYVIGLIVLFITSCSTKDTAPSDTSNIISESNDIARDSTVSIFNTSIHLDEEKAVRELAEAGILKCDTLQETDGQFENAVIEFAGVKFNHNRGFVFVTSKQDKQTIDSIVSKISRYYGDPFIDDSGDSEFDYYHWNLHEASSAKPYIKIRPLHSDEGGLVMTWSWN